MLVVRQAVVGPFAENTFLAVCSKTGEAVLVDPGGELPRVLALVDQGGYRVTRIFLTHAHVDHVVGAAEARRHFQVPLSLHAADREWLAQLPRQAMALGFDEPGEVPEVDQWHGDGDTFPVGELTAEVLHVPGHSRGSCALWFASERQLFTGDTLFAGSIGRTDLPGGSFEELERSITGRIFPLGPDVRFHCGHGPSASLGDEIRGNPFVGESARRGRFV